MHRIFKKEQILTIPNMLSIVRLLLIPIIVWLYTVKQEYYAALFVIFISGVTDVADGIIARRYNMVSDFGKILDPLADKATQAALILCLMSKYDAMLGLIIIFIAREAIMTLFGYLSLKRKDSVNSAEWYGKLNTVVVYGMIFVLILLPEIPMTIANAMICVSGGVMIFSLVMYVIFYKKILTNRKTRNKNAKKDNYRGIYNPFDIHNYLFFIHTDSA